MNKKVFIKSCFFLIIIVICNTLVLADTEKNRDISVKNEASLNFKYSQYSGDSNNQGNEIIADKRTAAIIGVALLKTNGCNKLEEIFVTEEFNLWIVQCGGSGTEKKPSSYVVINKKTGEIVEICV